MPPKAGRETVNPAERTRKHHTRSRAGCNTCRRRHIRCDEARPVCGNCSSGPRDCEYPLAAIPLRERRANAKVAPPPGAQEVWSVRPTFHVKEQGAHARHTTASRSRSHTPPAWQVVRSTKVDPFDTFAIKMPFKSQQLMRYFYETASHYGVASQNPEEDSMALVSHDPNALRCTLILAGLHYGWNHGSLSNFESTVLHHKAECMRTINSLINDCSAQAFTTCLQQIATLTMTECCSGNTSLSYAHLRGLTAVVEARERRRNPVSPGDELKDELADRYMVLVYNFVYGFKSRLSDAENFDRLSRELQRKVSGCPTPPRDPSEPPDELNDNIDFRLGAIRLIPYFFMPPPTGKAPKPVDVPAFLSALRDLTTMAVKAHRSPDLAVKARLFHAMWTEGTATRLFLVLVNTHRFSFFSGRQVHLCPDGQLASAWMGIAVASGLYLNSVLDIWNAGQPIEPRMLRLFLTILARDVKMTTQAIDMKGSPASGLWLWKVMVGALTVRKAENVGLEYRQAMDGLKNGWDARMQEWSVSSGIRDWKSVRSILATMAWPSEPLWDDLEETTWAEGITT